MEADGTQKKTEMTDQHGFVTNKLVADGTQKKTERTDQYGFVINEIVAHRIFRMRVGGSLPRRVSEARVGKRIT